MSQRGPNYHALEHEILCNAYIANTRDGEIGAYRKKTDLWKHIESSYNHEAVDKQHLQRRNAKSLLKQWDKISPSCVLFGSCLTSVEGRNQSGTNEAEEIKQALDLFLEKDPLKQAFLFMHCWEILKIYPKWSMPVNSQVGDGSSHADDGTSEDTPQNDVSAGSDGRGLGNKATKAKRRLNREKDPIWEEMMHNSSKTHELLEKQLATIDTTHQAKMHMEQKKLEIKQKKYECNQRQMDIKEAEVEQEILRKNLADMTPFSKAYWTNKKQVIVDGMTRKSRASRSLNFSDDGSGGSHVGRDFSQSYDNHHINTGNEGVYRPNTDDFNSVSDTYPAEYEVNYGTGTQTDLNVPWRLD